MKLLIFPTGSAQWTDTFDEDIRTLNGERAYHTKESEEGESVNTRVMNTGAIIGGIIGLLAGIGFMALSIYTQASRLDPPPFIAVIFAVAGLVIGHAVSESRRKKKVEEEER